MTGFWPSSRSIGLSRSFIDFGPMTFDPHLPVAPDRTVHRDGGVVLAAENISTAVKFLPMISAVISRIAVFITMMVAAHLLSPDGFGAFAVLTAVAAIAVPLVMGGGDMWLNRFSRRPSGQVFAAPLIWPYYTVIVLAMAAFVVLAASTVAVFAPPTFSYGPALVLAVTAAAITGVTESILAIHRASGRVGSFFIIRDIAAPTLVLLFILSFQPHTAVSIFAIILAVWAVILLVVLILLTGQRRILRHRARLRLGAFRRVLAHSWGLMYGNLASRLSIYTDIFALTLAIPLATVGIYRVASQFPIGFTVAQHYMFLSLPWQLRHIGTLRKPGDGHAAVIWRQRQLLGMAFIALVPLFFGAELLLDLFGPQFGRFAPLLQGFLLLRFGELFWGPQHEILISNGYVLRDAHISIGSVAIWTVAFLIAYTATPPIHAAVIAAACASICVHALRHLTLAKAQLRTGAGHVLGPALPIGLTLVAAVVALNGL